LITWHRVEHPVQNILLGSAPLRRFAWRSGRWLYSLARGEVLNDMATNGEAYVQSCVLANTKVWTGPINVFDVGANCGEWTRSLLDQLPDTRVAATRVFLFEPVPGTYARLQANLQGMAKHIVARAFQLAVSNEAGTADMAVFSEAAGTNSLEFDATTSAAFVKVKKVDLPTFCETHNVQHVHLLKCDTEGHDSLVLKGALELLRAARIDVAQFEYNHRWIHARAYLKDVFDLVADLPYSVARVCPSHIEIFEAWHPEMERFFEGNYLLVREECLKWFDARLGRFDASNTYA
jgi:FkbM family methyltransferase